MADSVAELPAELVELVEPAVLAALDLENIGVAIIFINLKFI